MGLFKISTNNEIFIYIITKCVIIIFVLMEMEYIHLYHLIIIINIIHSHYFTIFHVPYNSSITSIKNTIKHIKFDKTQQYIIYNPIKIPFTAYDIDDNPQKYGGDEFVIFAEDINITKQAFKVEDIFNGTYIIHLLLPNPAKYNVFIMHKFGCFDGDI